MLSSPAIFAASGLHLRPCNPWLTPTTAIAPVDIFLSGMATQLATETVQYKDQIKVWETDIQIYIYANIYANNQYSHFYGSKNM